VGSSDDGIPNGSYSTACQRELRTEHNEEVVKTPHIVCQNPDFLDG
jgi:hypothetical protein